MARDDVAEVAGRAVAVNESAKHVADHVVLNAEQGHGYAAEKANHLVDTLLGRNSEIVGGDLAKHGPDKLVDGVYIQTKYCKTGSSCVAQCFEDGTLKYVNADGTPMVIEVPSDKYDAAVQAMESRIEKGQVPGVTDPARAKDIVRRGHFTYEQARNIARFGTIEGLTYDAVNGVRVAGFAGGVSALLHFGVSVWRGEDIDVAMKGAVRAGLSVGGTAWVSSIIAAQLGRTSLEQGLRGATDWVVRQLGTKASATIANALRAGTNIYGAAALNHLSKLLRGNVVTGIAVTAVLSVGDLVRLFRGRVSAAQVFKNVTKTAGGVAGGTAGYMGGAVAGAALGTMVAPGAGTTIGAIAGGILGAMGGGYAATEAAGAVLDRFIEDDAVEMLGVFERVFAAKAQDYLLSQDEAEQAIDALKERGFADIVQQMYGSENRAACARAILVPVLDDIARARPRVSLPDPEAFLRSVGEVVEELAETA